MKKAIDKAIGLFLTLIAIFAGLAIAAELIRPYMGWIVAALVIVIVAVSAVFLSPMAGGVVDRIRNRDSNWSE